MKNKVKYILKKELRETFRDKKSLLMMLIIPLMIPLLVIGMSFLFENETKKSINDYNNIGFINTLSNLEESIAQSLNIDITYDTKENLEKSLKDGLIEAYVEQKSNNYLIHYKDSNINSSMGASLVESYLNTYKKYLQQNILKENNISEEDFNNIITYEYIKTEEQNFYANYVVNYAFMFIIMAITVSATYPATDTTAGEKERGTLETLLTFPLKSKDIILGKFYSVTISSIITGLLSLILALTSLSFVQNKYSIYAGISLLNNRVIIVSIFLILIYSLLISGLSIAIASMSKTFKEAQSALTPLTFISFFPGMIAFLLNIKNSFILSLIPFLNTTLLIEDAVNNNLNYLYLFLTFISTIIFISIVICYIIKQYKSEKVLFSN